METTHFKKDQQQIHEQTEIFIKNMKLLILQETQGADFDWTDLKLHTSVSKHRLLNFLKNPNIGMNFDTIVRILNYLNYKLLLTKV
mgnify:CR=1 FL=1